MTPRGKPLMVKSEKQNFTAFFLMRGCVPVLVFPWMQPHWNRFPLQPVVLQIKILSDHKFFFIDFSETLRESMIVDILDKLWVWNKPPQVLFGNYFLILLLCSVPKNETVPNILSLTSREGPGCVSLGLTELNQADPFSKQQPVVLLAQASGRGTAGCTP